MKFILWLQVCPKRGCNSHYIHVLLDGLWHMCLYANMPYWNFEYTKVLSLHCGKSGRWYGSCNWGNPFWVKFTSSFIQCMHAVKIGGWFNLKKVDHRSCSLIRPGLGGGSPLLQGFSVTPLVQWRFLAKLVKWNSFCDCNLSHKGCTSVTRSIPPPTFTTV